MTASDGPPFAARISALFAMLAPCLKALSVRSFKITDWARGLLKNTDYDLRSFGVHRSEYPALRSRSLVIAKVTNWPVKITRTKALSPSGSSAQPPRRLRQRAAAPCLDP